MLPFEKEFVEAVERGNLEKIRDLQINGLKVADYREIMYDVRKNRGLSGLLGYIGRMAAINISAETVGEVNLLTANLLFMCMSEDDGYTRRFLDRQEITKILLGVNLKCDLYVNVSLDSWLNYAKKTKLDLLDMLIRSFVAPRVLDILLNDETIKSCLEAEDLSNKEKLLLDRSYVFNAFHGLVESHGGRFYVDSNTARLIRDIDNYTQALAKYAGTTLADNLEYFCLTSRANPKNNYFQLLIDSAKGAGHSEQVIKEWIEKSGLIYGTLWGRPGKVLKTILDYIGKNKDEELVAILSPLMKRFCRYCKQDSHYSERNRYEQFDQILELWPAQPQYLNTLALYLLEAPEGYVDGKYDIGILAKKLAAKGRVDHELTIDNRKTTVIAEILVRRCSPRLFSALWDNCDKRARFEGDETYLSKAVSLMINDNGQRYTWYFLSQNDICWRTSHDTYFHVPKDDDCIIGKIILGSEPSIKNLKLVCSLFSHIETNDIYKNKFYWLIPIAKKFISQTSVELRASDEMQEILEAMVDANQAELLFYTINLGVKPKPKILARCFTQTVCNSDIYMELIYNFKVDLADESVQDALNARGENAKLIRGYIDEEIKIREEAERKAREEAERKAREEAERKAREEAERKASEAEQQSRFKQQGNRGRVLFSFGFGCQGPQSVSAPERGRRYRKTTT